MKKNLFKCWIIVLLILFQGSIYGGGIKYLSGSLDCEEICGTISITASAECTCEDGSITIDCSGIGCTSGNATKVTATSWTISGPGTYSFSGAIASCTCEVNDATLSGSVIVEAVEVGEPGDDVIVECEGCEKECKPSTTTIKNNTGCTITVKINENVFKVTGGTEGPGAGEIEIAANSSITLTLARPYESLSEAEKKSTIDMPDGRKIKIRKSGSDPDGFTAGPMMPGGMGSILLPNGEGCTSCGSGSGASSHKHEYHNMEVNIMSREENTLANKSSVLDVGTTNPYAVEANINLGGDWFAVHQRDGWESVKCNNGIDSEVPSGSTGFRVTDPEGNKYYYYETGTAMPDNPKLRKVLRETGTGENDVDTITYNYTGDMLNYQEDENDNQIQYNYTSWSLTSLDFNDGTTDERTISFAYDSDGKLAQMDCASCNDAQTSYTYVGSNELNYDSDISANVHAHQYLSEIKDADEETVFYFKYDDSDRILEHRMDGSNGNLITKWSYTDDSSGNVQQILRKDYIHTVGSTKYYRATEYNYDTDSSLSSVIKFHNLQTASTPSGARSGIEHSYDTGTNVLETIQEYLLYNSTNDDVVSSGLMSITETVDNSSDDADGYLKRKLMYDTSTTTSLVKQQYSYGLYPESSEVVLNSVTNARGGVTNYYYDPDSDFELEKALGPTISTGSKITNSNYTLDRSDSRKVHDSLGRIQYEFHKDGRGEWIGRSYAYDSSTGRLDTVKDGVVFDVTEDETGDGFSASVNTEANAVVTSYSYTSFGEPNEVATIVPDGGGTKKVNIRRTYYDINGVKIGQTSLLAEEVLTDGQVTTEAQVVSAIKYTYDSNGRLIIKSIVKEDAAFPEEDLSTNDDDLMDDLDVILTVDSTTNEVELDSSFGLTWVHTVYVYDKYGQRTAVIADATEEGLTARSHLTTEYAYNYQGEITEVKYPDGKMIKTTRDGRGFVTKEETGYDPGSGFTAKITVEYTYDDYGNLKTKTEPHPNVDADGDDTADDIKTVYTYDNFNRLVGTHTETVIN